MWEHGSGTARGWEMSGGWTIPKTTPSLAVDRVQVWRIDLDEMRSNVSGFLQVAAMCLSDEERLKAQKKRAGGPRQEFIAGRGSLRVLLGAAIGIEPEEVVIEAGEFHKPRLAGAHQMVPAFNVSHSRGIVLIALAADGEIGVDVEYVNRDIEVEEVGRTAFHVNDLARIERAAARDEKVTEFFRCWTRKEAVAKADGRGLMLEPTSFAAGWDGDRESEVTLPGSGQSYFVQGIEVGPRHAAAVATTVSGVTVHCYELWPGSPLRLTE
jgi:4'-phosphopantetheinyl transferase